MNTEDYPNDDNKLVAQVQSGNIAVYEEIVAKYQETIALQMRRFSRDTHDIEDLTQQVFINAYTSINNYKPKAPFIHWLKTIASRTGYNFWRENAKKPCHVSIEEWDCITPEDELSELTPEEAEERLEFLLSKLLPNERHAVYLMYVEDMSIKEITEITGWSGGKIKMLALRGRNKLKEALSSSRRIENNG